MPDSNYEFKPTERQHSFMEKLLHIKGNLKWLSTTYFTDKDYAKDTDTTASKNEMIALLALEFDVVFYTIKNLSECRVS